MPADNSPTTLGFVTGLQCIERRTSYTLQQLKREKGSIFQYVCDDCLGPLDVQYDMERVRTAVETIRGRPDTYWKFAELLPANRQHVAKDMPFTPLIKSRRLGSKLGIDLYFKLDTELPTGTFKDRPVAMAVNCAVESGDYRSIIVASTGNLAISSAHFAAKNGMSCEILVPRSLGEIKKSVIRRFLGDKGKLIELDAPYDAVNRIAMERADEIEKNGTMVLGPNTTFRPYYKEGSKTNGMEIAWQLDKVEPYDRNFYNIYPVGSGALLSSAHKGIKELTELGITSRKVHMVAVQPETCSPIVDAFIKYKSTGVRNITPVEVTDETTIAKSIAIGEPGSGYQAVDVLVESSGNAVRVSEQEIVEWCLKLYETEGVFAQDVGGVTMAGISRLVNEGEIKPNSLVVANITGTGKDRFEDDLLSAAKRYTTIQNKFVDRTRAILSK